MQAMILAAGFGTRLLPYSAHRPKPLFPVLGMPLLLLTIKSLKAAGFTKIIVNCHYLKEQIVDAVAGISGVIVQEEDIVLGTGGGLRRALQYMDDEPLLIVNGDIYHTLDWVKLYQSHIKKGATVTMAVHHYPRFTALKVEEGRVVQFGYKEADGFAFTGIHVINPEKLAVIEPDKKSCITELYKSMIVHGECIDTYRIDGIDGAYWTDMGTPDDYLALHEGLIRGMIPCLSALKAQGQVICDEDTWAMVGDGVSVPKGTKLCRTVVWAGAVLEARDYCNEIVIEGDMV